MLLFVFLLTTSVSTVICGTVKRTDDVSIEGLETLVQQQAAMIQQQSTMMQTLQTKVTALENKMSTIDTTHNMLLQTGHYGIDKAGDVMVVTVVEGPGQDRLDKGACLATTHLTAGQHVMARHVGGSTYLNSYQTSFSGFLIAADTASSA
ncbi:hypothetical protein BaRGS_00018956 [Batillaria attramentaria]|uniref:C1q domain-containing protein n=1 Tax=Batillaria attramentaria TaxID=370345 RepID=A0ABD0KSC4_9CAEN